MSLQKFKNPWVTPVNFAGKKPVLSNRQLTRKVRTLDNQQGQRTYTGSAMASAVTLTAGTARIDTAAGLADSTVHYIDYVIKAVATAGATLRLIFFMDELYAGTAAVVGDILAAPTDSASHYSTNDTILPLKEARHKNREFDARVVVYEDRTIPLIANEPRFFKVRQRMNGRKFRNNDGNINPRFGVMALADEANVTYSINRMLYYTVDT